MRIFTSFGPPAMLYGPRSHSKRAEPKDKIKVLLSPIQRSKTLVRKLFKLHDKIGPKILRPRGEVNDDSVSFLSRFLFELFHLLTRCYF